MAIDKKTGKRIPVVKQPDQILAEQKAKAKPKFDMTYEEELINQLFEEKKKKIEKTDFKIPIEEVSVFCHHERLGEEWDVPINEEIKYFDPELSYELTHYRPITMEKGLDFNPNDFREMAIIYESNGKYTEFPEGTKPWRDLWMREIDRMKNGYEVNGYRITGDNYYYLNYYRMQTVSEDSNKAGEGRSENFPMFLSKQYEWFHYVELAEMVGRDAGALKARGVGWSEMTAAMSVRPYTVIPKYNVLLTAAAEDQLRPLLDKCWFQLDWLNTNTSGGLRHVRQKVNNSSTKRASKVLRDGTEIGFQSQIDSIIADEAKKIRGYRQDRLVFEECFGRGTKVIMSDYSRKNIEDIKVGDFVLGINGAPQEVVKTCNGVDDLYLVKQKTGIEYIVNSRHKLFFEKRNCWTPIPEVLMTPVEFIGKTKSWKDTAYGLSCQGIDNKNYNYEVDPYYFGLWIGDGYSSHPNRIIVNVYEDREIADFLLRYFKSFSVGDIRISPDSTEKCMIYSLTQCGRENNPIIQQYKRLGLYNNKCIPVEVLMSSLDYKLQVLAGIIDTDGFIKSKNRLGKSFEIEMSRRNLIYEIGNLAQSCGFKVAYSERVRDDGYAGKTNKQSHTWSVTIKGDINKIPVKLPRKKVIDIRQQKICSTRISVEKQGFGEYFGFTLKSYGDKWDNFFYLDDYTIVHNCGNNKNLAKSWVQGAALTQLGGIHFGTRIFLGTSGEELDMDGLARMFQDPSAFDVLPYKNYDTYDGKPQLTAFFLPAHKFALSSKYLDSRGVTNWPEFKKYYEEQRSKLKGQDYLNECAEHCFVPEEALAKTGANVFDSELISEQIANIKLRGLGKTITPTQLEWDRSAPDYSKVKAYESKDSKLLVIEPPKLDPEGNVWKNLYVAGIDGLDIGTDNSATDTDVSSFCIVIKKRVFGGDEPEYVAIYKDRPRDIRVAYMIALKMLVWYNCQAMLEFTKIGFQQFLRERKKENLLMSRPEYAVSTKNKKKITKRLIGVPSTESVIKHGLELVSGFLADYYYTIQFTEMLDELLKYTYENKRKFDIVAALQMVEIGDEVMSGIIPAKQLNIAKQWKDFGWYRDENGYLKHGIIPDKRY